MLTGACGDGCSNIAKLNYAYKAYKSWNLTTPTNFDIQEKWVPYLNRSSFIGLNTFELTVSTDLFTDNTTNIFKFELDITTESLKGSTSTGSSSFLAYVNKLPVGGKCSLTPNNAILSSTIVFINCSNWYDPDGQIVKYSFFSVFLNDEMNVGLGYSLDGKFLTRLPPGAVYDSYKMRVYVQITDNDDGVTYFEVSGNLTVQPDTSNLQSIVDQIVSGDTKSLFNEGVNEGDSQATIQDILGIISMINVISMSDKKGLSGINSE